MKEQPMETLQRRVERNPSSLVFPRLADGYRKRGDLQQAISICIQGLSRYSNHIAGRLILGRCYLEHGNTEGALQEFVRVCMSDRRNLVALKMLADAYSRRPVEEKRARQLYAHLLRMDPSNPSLQQAVGAGDRHVEITVPEILGAAAALIRQPETAAGASAPLLDLEEVIDRATPVDQAADIEELTTPDKTAVEMPGITRQPHAAAEDDLTGDDITNRMSLMFGEEEPAADFRGTSAAVEPETGLDLHTDEINLSHIAEKAETGELPSALFTEEAAAAMPTSEDIGSRVEELFGEESDTALHPQAAAETEAAFGDIAVGPAPAPHEIDGDLGVCGDDVSQRLEELAIGIESEAPDAGTAAEEPPAEELAASGYNDDPITFSKDADLDTSILEGKTISLDRSKLLPGSPLESETVVVGSEAAASLWNEDQTATGDAQPIAAEQIDAGVSGEDVSARIEEVFGEISFQAAPREQLAAGIAEEAAGVEEPQADVERAAGQQPLGGGDVAKRIDQIFGESDLVNGETIEIPSAEIRAAAGLENEAAAPANLDTVEDLAYPEADRRDGIELSSIESSPAGTAAAGNSLDSIGLDDIEEIGAGQDAFFSPQEGIAQEQSLEFDLGSSEETAPAAILQTEADSTPTETYEIIGAADKDSADNAGEEELSIADTVLPDADSTDVNGTDVLGRLDEMFPGDAVTESDLSATIPEETGGNEDAVQGFYTISGEPATAADQSETAVPDDIDKVELEAPLEDFIQEPQNGYGAAEMQSPAAVFSKDASGEATKEMPQTGQFSDDVEPATLSNDAAEDETVILSGEMVDIGKLPEEEIAPAAPPDAQSHAAGGEPGNDKSEDDAQRPASILFIPDHVLTPTLADIYYQQGQNELAIQIYRRLLDRDPDNERIMRRIGEIEGVQRAVAQQAEAMPQDAGKVAAAPRKAAAGRAHPSPARRAARRKEASGDKPLKGVKIKKKYKDKYSRRKGS